jgi:outer membrane murein-binding lipoprotein Lpp
MTPLERSRRRLALIANDAYIILKIVYRNHLELPANEIQDMSSRWPCLLRVVAAKMMVDNLVRKGNKTELKKDIGKYLGMFVGRPPYPVKTIENMILRHKKFMLGEGHEFHNLHYDESLEIYFNRPMLEKATVMGHIYVGSAVSAQEIDRRANILWQRNFELKEQIDKLEAELTALKNSYDANKANATELNRRWQKQAEKSLKTYYMVEQHRSSRTNDRAVVFDGVVRDWRKTYRQ